MAILPASFAPDRGPPVPIYQPAEEILHYLVQGAAVAVPREPAVQNGMVLLVQGASMSVPREPAVQNGMVLLVQGASMSVPRESVL